MENTKRLKTFKTTITERSKKLIPTLKKHVVSKKTIHKSLTYNMKLRGLWGASMATIFLLGDEWLKEGYLFYPPDMLKFGTHENLILMLWILVGLKILRGDNNE